jgi:hypothetical protein
MGNGDGKGVLEERFGLKDRGKIQFVEEDGGGWEGGEKCNGAN